MKHCLWISVLGSEEKRVLTKYILLYCPVSKSFLIYQLLSPREIAVNFRNTEVGTLPWRQVTTSLSYSRAKSDDSVKISQWFKSKTLRFPYPAIKGIFFQNWSTTHKSMQFLEYRPTLLKRYILQKLNYCVDILTWNPIYTIYS